MNKFFITGTDTNVGKTLVSAVLTLALQGYYWKPIECGLADEISDYKTIQQLTALPDIHFFPSNYSLKASLSPHQAAELENITIDINNCQLPMNSQPLIVEGAGGVFVPINQHECLLDLMKKFHLPIIIVSRGTLGTLNHTLLTIEALRTRGLNIYGVIFSGELNLKNQTTIEKWGEVKTLLHVPWFKEVTRNSLQTWVSQEKQKILEVFI